MIKELMIYRFRAKLQYTNKDDYYIVSYQVIAKDRYKAKDILLKWLSKPEQTGFKYSECVGIIDDGCKTALVEEEE